MTRTDRQRSARRVLLVALAISAGIHAAALAWLAMPIRSPAVRAPAFVMLPPPAEPAPAVAVIAPVTPARQSATARDGGAHVGEATRAAPRRGVPAENLARSADAAVPMSFAVAGSDSLPAVELLPASVEPMPAVASAGATSDGSAGATPAATHSPGGVGNAKDQWAGGTSGGASAGPGSGRGIGIKIGGPKRHPPIGSPGRRGGGVRW